MLRMKTRNAMKNFEILRTNDKRKVEIKMKIIENNLGEGMWLMEIILKSHFERISE